MTVMLVPIIIALLRIFDTVVEIYIFVVIAAVVMSWLIAFGVLNLHNQLARSLVTMLDALTEPVLRQVRRIIPTIGGLDLSPVIVIIVLQVGSGLIDEYVAMLITRMSL